MGIFKSRQQIVASLLKHFDRETWWLYMFTDFIKDLRNRGASNATVNWYKGKFAIWLNWLIENGYQNWNEIQPETCAKFLDWLARTPNPRNGKLRSNRTVLGYYKALNVGFAYGIRRGLFETNPMEGIPAPKVKKEVPAVYRKEWIEKIIQTILESRSCNKLRNVSIIHLLADTGIRRSELCNLNICDLDLARQEVLITDAKSYRSRVVGYGTQTAKFLQRYLEEERPAGGESLFLTPEKEQISGYTVWLFIRQACDKAGVPRIPKTVHSFRSTFAVNWKNGPLTLKDAGGWSSLAMPEYYSQYNRGQRAADYQKAGSIFDE